MLGSMNLKYAKSTKQVVKSEPKNMVKYNKTLETSGSVEIYLL